MAGLGEGRRSSLWPERRCFSARGRTLNLPFWVGSQAHARSASQGLELQGLHWAGLGLLTPSPSVSPPDRPPTSAGAPKLRPRLRRTALSGRLVLCSRAADVLLKNYWRRRFFLFLFFVCFLMALQKFRSNTIWHDGKKCWFDFYKCRTKRIYWSESQSNKS